MVNCRVSCQSLLSGNLPIVVGNVEGTAFSGEQSRSKMGSCTHTEAHPYKHRQREEGRHTFTHRFMRRILVSGKDASRSGMPGDSLKLRWANIPLVLMDESSLPLFGP